ncbi:MAG: ABC transporter ATP-binding protein [Pseudomonadota bacterium]
MSDVSYSRGVAHDNVDVDTTLTVKEVLVILKRAFEYVWPVKGLFFLKFALMIGSLVPVLVAPWPIKILIDHVVLEAPLTETTIRFPPFIQPFVDAMVAADPSQLLFATVVVLVLLFVIFGAGGSDERFTGAFLAQGQDTATQSENMISAGWSMAGGLWGLIDLLCNIRLVQRVTNGLRTQLFRRLLRLPMRVLDDHRIGDGVYRTMYDAPAVQGVCFDLTLMPAIAILATGAAVYVMQYSFGPILPELFWLALLVLPLTLLTTVPLAGAARRTSQAARGAGSTTTTEIEEQMSNIQAVQSHGREDAERDQFESASNESFRQYRRFMAVTIGIEMASMLALGVIALTVVLLVTDSIIAGDLSPGDFMVVLGLFMAIAGASVTLGRLWVDLQGNVAGVRRVLFYVDIPGDDALPGDQRPAAMREGIEFQNVSFDYPDGRRALSDINFSARIGETVALVGPTGAGKTTFAYMVPGFLTPTEGQILVDGEDIRGIDIDTLRGFTTYVFQEHLLMSDSIAENIRLGRPEASDDEIRQAAEISGASEFIERLPEGYDTALGRDGGKLSVGQKQRLSIARGLVRQTPVLILDEPTAAIDPDTEKAMMKALDAASDDRIVMIIAHRLSTIASVDRICFFDEGRIVEQGSHNELMSIDGGAYRRFVDLQTGNG